MKTQRTIKFRVWDEKYKCWVKNSFLLYPEDEIKIQGRILTQFTGLTDKNGKEIYEGDIVKFELKNKIYEVIYYEGHPCFMFLPIDIGPNLMEFFLTVNFSDFIPNHFQTKEYEILGNIFENSELLNEKI